MLENTSYLNFILNFAQLICWRPSNSACVTLADGQELLLHTGSCWGLTELHWALRSWISHPAAKILEVQSKSENTTKLSVHRIFVYLAS